MKKRQPAHLLSALAAAALCLALLVPGHALAAQTPLPVAGEAPPPVASVCLDPGHGGPDIGVGGPGLAEKDLALAICLRVRALLEKKGYRIYLTRASDAAVPVEDRTGLANHRQCDAFISVHADSGFSEAAAGPKVYSFAEPALESRRQGGAAASPADWRRVPALTRQEGTRLARAVALGLEGVQLPARAVREAPLVVLVGARMPAALVEVGVLPAESARLARGEAQDRLANGIARGIDLFFRPGSIP